MKFWLYSSASLAACAGLLWYTYVTRQQFYPSVIYLVTSKVSVLVLGNAGLVLTTLFGRLLKSFFLGTLRDAEVELLHENVRYAVTETCLALTIFREEISFHVMVLFTALVFLKIFHWLSQARIEFIEQTDVISRLTHVRLVGLMAMLAAVDTGFVVWCTLKVMESGPSVFILFGFEFLILLVTIVAMFLRYVLYVVDSRMDGAWTNKFTYLFYLELVSEVTKLVVYLVFFMLIFTYYGMPLHIVRDLWISIKNLQRRIASYFRYRKITAHLNERFPNPTEEELQETDRTDSKHARRADPPFRQDRVAPLQFQRGRRLVQQDLHQITTMPPKRQLRYLRLTLSLVLPLALLASDLEWLLDELFPQLIQLELLQAMLKPRHHQFQVEFLPQHPVTRLLAIPTRTCRQ
ncbi:hypothetical protein PF010_g25422 [Phytophthora fragariae]|uniref:E3 ubiquitin-protein ligase synoviolin-like TPR repeats domain-containing protein n=1 Tax=Phytophthora fragariae TaxID=53985 RepID=A0A6G0JZP9_9STRA|nr:hypothetical protein PF003_g32896 [Phytophthora fragariae]KAE9072598.1 hypothetical protein PF010_g25422 [Phytophthora fragariae]KAE9180734.1 hypothetical protein PF004_g24747 [Phytophthora fragariae]